MQQNQRLDRYCDALWAATAVAEPGTAALETNLQCDVAIVGAGFTGLNAALRLAKSGLSVCVLEKNNIGFGASGRSGGQVNLGLNLAPSQLVARFGPEKGKRLIDLVLRTPDSVFDLIELEKMDCHPVSNGWIQGAINDSLVRSQQVLADEYSPYGFEFEQLNKLEVEDRTGSSLYKAGLFCAKAGSVQPLSYTRELARVAISYGASVFTESSVTGIAQQADGWRLSTLKAEVRARKVLICTNGYTEADTGNLTRSLHRKVVPVRSVLVATEPLSSNLRETVLPNQVTFVDKRRLILYMRYDHEGRLCIGDRGPMRDTFVDKDFDGVKRRALMVFPQLENVSWQYQWGGRVAVTKNSLPFIHEIAPGLVAGMGYNGRGVGMGTMIGQSMADAIIGDSWECSDFPVTTADSFLLHRFKDVGVSASVRWFALLDYLSLDR